MKIQELMRLLSAVGIEYKNDPKIRKLKFRTNAITPNRLCDILVVYSEDGKIDDILGEPILQDELNKILEEEKKNKKPKAKTGVKIEELVELIMIEADSEDGYAVNKSDWMKEAERRICEKLVDEGKLILLGKDFSNYYYQIKDFV
jgi:hypothetical protein